MAFLGDLGLAGVNGALSIIGNEISSNTARKNLDYQMEKYYSPQAQVKNLGAAGINPAVAFGNQSPTFSGGGQLQMPSNPLSGIGTTSLTDLANYMNAKANAKKSGAETRNLDIDAKAKQFELELNKYFSAPEKIAALTLAWKNVMLKNDEHNINEWKQESEKALSQLKGIERDSAQKLLDNMDIQIEQENKQRSENIKLIQEKQKTEGTQQAANRAAAKNQLSQSEYYREYARLQRTFADIEESGKYFKLESLIKHYRATGMLDDASYQKAYKLYKNLASINADNDEHSWNQAADDLFYYLGEKIHQISPIGGMLDIDYTKK